MNRRSLITALGTAFAGASVAAQPQYDVEILGNIIGAKALNNLGDVVGKARDDAGEPVIVIRKANGKVVELPNLFEVDGNVIESALHIPSDLNDRGQVVGFVDVFTFPELSGRYGALWESDGTVRDLGHLNIDFIVFNEPTAINNDGRVLGMTVEVGPRQGYTADAPDYDLAQFDGHHPESRTQPLAINDRGQIVGETKVPSDLLCHNQAFVRDPDGTLRLLALLDVDDFGIPFGSRAYGINEAGLAVGSADIGAPFHTFWPVRWPSDRSIQPLLEGSQQAVGWSGIALALNDAGEIVGTFNAPDFVDRGFVWRDDGLGVVDLNEVTDTPLFINFAIDINRRGQILASTTGGVSVLLTPIGCDADLDDDGDADAEDFFAYLDLFASGDERADLDGDGDLDAKDFFAYLDVFARGCA